MKIEQAKAHITMPDLLARLGFQGEERNGELWYHSPFRDERTASFKLTRDGRAWYDHGIGEGGDVVTFARRYWECDTSQALRQLSDLYLGSLFDTPPTVEPRKRADNAAPGLPLFAERERENREDERTGIEIGPITSKGLYWYLHHRGIDPQLAKRYLKEMRYKADDKEFYVLAFASDEGGWELRNGVGVSEGKHGFQGNYGPKAITVLYPEKATPGGSVSVFEGFFDFLTALSYYGKDEPSTPVIVMNSAALRKQTAAAIERLVAGRVHLYLDRDETGQDATQAIREALPDIMVEDRSGLYAAYADFNDFWMKEGKQAKLAKQPHFA